MFFRRMEDAWREMRLLGVGEKYEMTKLTLLSDK